jgi:hypothetical protein
MVGEIEEGAPAVNIGATGQNPTIAAHDLDARDLRRCDVRRCVRVVLSPSVLFV